MYIYLFSKAAPKKITSKMVIRIDKLLHENNEVTFRQIRTTVQLKFNFTLARKDTRAFTSFLRGITEYFSSI